MRKYAVIIGLCLAFATVLPAGGLPRVEAAKSSADYKDLSTADAKTKQQVDTGLALGLFQGVTEDRFGLNETVNRAELAIMVALAVHLRVDVSRDVSHYDDVQANDPDYGYALPYIEALQEAGIIDGSGANRFEPGGDVTREQLAVILIRSSSKHEKEAQLTGGVNDPTVSDYAKPYVALALQKYEFLRTDGNFEGTKSIERRMYCGCKPPDAGKLVQSLDAIPDKVPFFIRVFDKLMSLDSALNGNMKFISIYVKNVQNDWTEEERTQLAAYVEQKYGVELLYYSHEQLVSHQWINEQTKSLQGILLQIEKIRIDESGTVATVAGAKYRSPKGAVGTEQLILKRENNDWAIHEMKGSWIS
ncbi:S-layer homology domain-containing protein [Paenibacillus allorhizosphaerae]|uniref:SLH domain-containing protein n=1 Tax=Paenibacillus allorhizosphaerae TaxID=2849866 RepID=A0ABM8VAZ9_9BACL|nr:S-layer homology domain-containing protein [Paenibacillus allorhizosphaerae]CAG7617875.1 hypothetical protein PAECIP111802_00461 [Paenibacillus allorhizosphaerae]